MSIDIVRGASPKPASSDALVQLMASQTDWSGQMFTGYPIISTAEGPHPIDALLVSVDKGIVVFDLIEGPHTGGYGVRQDDTANKLEARLRTHRELMQGRNLRIPIHTVSFAPGVSPLPQDVDNGHPISNRDTLIQALKRFKWETGEESVYKAALSALESISTIRKTKTKRTIRQEDSRGAKLKNLENSIATLDAQQMKAVIETVEGVQRIRGLAGSGKTIVLALKAAYLHAQHPSWRIAVTFNTRSLKGQFHRLINNFSLEQTGQEPDWENLRIVNAWGDPGGGHRDGVYDEFCRVHDVEYFDFQSARKASPRGKELFSGICERALRQARKSQSVYDALLVDEAQDFSPAFLELCYALLDGHKRLVYAYDELQNLSEESLPSPEDIFGKNADGSPKVRFDDLGGNEPSRDLILKKCYRNSRPVLVTAHALGFGIYRQSSKPNETGLIQMFDHPRLWEEIGYRSREGELMEGSSVILHRTPESSPTFLEHHSDIDDLILFKRFDNEQAQADWLVESIKNNLKNDELRHDDIIVINPNPLTTREKVGPIRGRLLEMGIGSHLAGVDTDADVFFQPDATSVTFTGVHRAKGNEAGMVYIINAQDCHSAARNLASIRNRLFTAITRSKAWVRVLGIGHGMNALMQEYEELQRQNFELKFTYPTKEQREQLQTIHRDMTTAEGKQLQKYQQSVTDLINDLDSGKVHREDLDENMIARLKEHLG